MQNNIFKNLIKLAQKGEGKVSPNPMVACIIEKNGKILSKGFHKKYGGAHAERNALSDNSIDYNGSNCYVLLEPCSHYGKTPPCTDIIIEKKIKKVIILNKDINNLAVSNSYKILTNNNVEVEYLNNDYSRKAIFLNRAFYINQIYKRSFVFAKWAQTVDGKIADMNSNSKFITGEKSRNEVQKLRYKADAVLVGINTVLKDNPSLTVRLKNKSKNILRIVLDTDLKIPVNSELVKTAHKNRLLIVTNSKSKEKIKILQKSGAEILLHKTKDLINLTKTLYQNYNIGILMVEGGGKVLNSFFEKKLIDEYYVFTAPKIAGDNNWISSIDGFSKRLINSVEKLELINVKKFANDIMVNYYGNNTLCLPELLKKYHR